MKYLIKHSNGLERLIDDYKIDKSTSLSLIGQNVQGFTDTYNENLEKLINNFSSNIPPNNPILGQLWYKNDEKILYVFDGGWNRINAPKPDMSKYVLKSNGFMDEYLMVNESIVPSETSVISRSYVDTKKFKFKDQKNAEVSYVKHDNDYTIINMNVSMDSKKKKIYFPYQMKDVNYSISASVNTIDEDSVDTAITFFDKTINGFGMIIDSDVKIISIIVMGYMTENPIEIIVEPEIILKNFKFKLSESWADRLPQFNVYIMDDVNYIGYIGTFNIYPANDRTVKQSILEPSIKLEDNLEYGFGFQGLNLNLSMNINNSKSVISRYIITVLFGDLANIKDGTINNTKLGNSNISIEIESSEHNQPIPQREEIIEISGDNFNDTGEHFIVGEISLNNNVWIYKPLKHNMVNVGSFNKDNKIAYADFKNIFKLESL